QMAGRGVQRSERREVGGQTCDDELEEVNGPLNILEAVPPYIAQAHALRQLACDQVTRRLRKQHLASMSSAHDPSCIMHIQAHVALSRTLGLTRVQPHAHMYCNTSRPGMRSQSTLGCYRCRDRIGGTRKGHEEGISLRINFA